MLGPTFMDLLIALGIGLLVGLHKERAEPPLEPGNPSELKPAILFGALHAVVLLVVASAQDLLEDVGCLRRLPFRG